MKGVEHVVASIRWVCRALRTWRGPRQWTPEQRPLVQRGLIPQGVCAAAPRTMVAGKVSQPHHSTYPLRTLA